MKFKILIYSLVIFFFTFAIYLNSTWSSFHLDDNEIIKGNPNVEEINNFPKIFSSNYWANTPYADSVLLYRPIPVASFALDHIIWKDNPVGYHLTNIFFNALNSVLVFLLLLLIFKEKVQDRYILLAALLFAAHPVHTEVINMVVARTEIFALFFTLLAFISYLKDKKILSYVLFFAGLLSKETALMLPFAIFLYEWLFKKDKSLGRYIPYVLVTGVYLFIRMSVLGGFTSKDQSGILAGQDILGRIATVALTLGHYKRVFFLPYGLSPDYSDVPLPTSIIDIRVLIALVTLVIMLVLFIRSTKKNGYFAFAWGWFVLFILPVSNIVSIGAFAGDRFLYLPSVFAAFLVCSMLNDNNSRFVKLPVLTFLAFLVVLSSIAVVIRNNDWRSPETLWEKTLKRRPDNPRANYFVAAALESNSKPEEAIKYYKKSIEPNPKLNWKPDRRSIDTVKAKISKFYCDESIKFYKEKKYKESEELAKKALEEYTENADALVMMGNIEVTRQKYRKALEYYEKAVKLAPGHPEAKQNLENVKKYLGLK